MLAGRVVVVTGAGSGIGRSCCFKCAQHGALGIVAVDRNFLQVTETARLVSEDIVGSRTPPSSSFGIMPYEADISKKDQVEKMIVAAVEKFTRFDAAINCAGVEGERAGIETATEENFDQVMGINAKGMFLCLQAQIKQMRKQQVQETVVKASSSSLTYSNIDKSPCYSIVNIASTAGTHGMPEFVSYCASKHAVIGITKTVAIEVAPHGIRVNAICPSTTDTPMVERFTQQWPEWQEKQNSSFPVGRIGRPEEVAAMACFLLSSECCMMSGSCVTIDGAASA